MRLVHAFPHSLPVDWPEDAEARIYLVEDGDEQVLYVDYQDAHFVRPMAPWKAEELRTITPSEADYQRKQQAIQ